MLSEPVSFPGTPDSTDLDVLHDGTLHRAGSPLIEQDIKDLKGLYDDLKRICAHAKERGVRVMIDAEHRQFFPPK